MTAKNKAPFKVGDLVTTEFTQNSNAEGTELVVRKVISVMKDIICGSGWRVGADAGESCPTCGRYFAVNTGDIDSTWFKKVTDTN